ncbi:MAG TPA: NnrS family protein [Gammaproteobacteria bacterium]|nr:NnrS family protein [Gammaproteobacteria bacterium]
MNTLLYRMPIMQTALLQQPFRLFFLGASLFASLGMLLWATFLHLGLLPASSLSPLLWHGHEMLFGFAGALVAGFLLTAVANWTGQATTTPLTLTLLIAIWLLARLGFLMPDTLPLALTATVDCAFFPLLAVIVARPIVRARNYRNLFVVGLVVAFALADLLFFLGDTGVINLAPTRTLFWMIDLLTVLMLAIGGRVIPFFTGRRLPTVQVYRNAWLDRSVNGGAALLVLLDIVTPGGALLGAMSMAIAALALCRLIGWRPWQTVREPMLWILHLGYLWLSAGLTLRGIALLGGPLREITALHAITVGALGSLAIGMMLRVSQGHTGRVITAGPVMATVFLLVSVATALRLTELSGMLPLAGTLWAVAFATLFFKLLPIQFGPPRM